MESSLIAAAKGGDASAFETLMGAYEQRVYALCLRMMGNPHDGEDVAQEAMLCHKSQVKHGWQVEDGGENDNSLFGLYFTCVGPDEAKNDFLEHIE